MWMSFGWTMNLTEEQQLASSLPSFRSKSFKKIHLLTSDGYWSQSKSSRWASTMSKLKQAIRGGRWLFERFLSHRYEAFQTGQSNQPSLASYYRLYPEASLSLRHRYSATRDMASRCHGRTMVQVPSKSIRIIYDFDVNGRETILHSKKVFVNNQQGLKATDKQKKENISKHQTTQPITMNCDNGACEVELSALTWVLECASWKHMNKKYIKRNNKSCERPKRHQKLTFCNYIRSSDRVIGP